MSEASRAAELWLDSGRFLDRDAGPEAADLIRALRAENERLREALREIDQKTGHFGEAPPPPEWMPMLSLIAWVGRTARAALAEIGGER